MGTLRDTLNTRMPAYCCHIGGCDRVFDSLPGYVHHYQTLHQNNCSFCRRSFPSDQLLDIHLMDRHGTVPTCPIRAAAARSRRPFPFYYQCPVWGCNEKFMSPEEQTDHLIQIHEYPAHLWYDVPPNPPRSTSGASAAPAAARAPRPPAASGAPEGPLPQGRAGSMASVAPLLAPILAAPAPAAPAPAAPASEAAASASASSEGGAAVGGEGPPEQEPVAVREEIVEEDEGVEMDEGVELDEGVEMDEGVEEPLGENVEEPSGGPGAEPAEDGSSNLSNPPAVGSDQGSTGGFKKAE
ncbi:zinc finger protein 511 [Monodelphis domestica]|uniref:zinc finger protein 511 n=1 Tax=Monodelphis domestica TaxID=13616 RepID=UPI0024E1DFDE|nr:zinc finger protein 511 [Monodelphis domestica]